MQKYILDSISWCHQTFFVSPLWIRSHKRTYPVESAELQRGYCEPTPILHPPHNMPLSVASDLQIRHSDSLWNIRKV